MRNLLVEMTILSSVLLFLAKVSKVYSAMVTTSALTLKTTAKMRYQINNSRSLSERENDEIQEKETILNLMQEQGKNANNNSTSSQNKNEKQLRRYRRRLKSTSLPEFSAPIGNVTAVLGRDVRLICTVEHLGQYQVAWLKEETKTILSIDSNIIITNYRIFLIPDEEERKWVLHIKDVQESDRGFYQCQVNTSPMRSTRGYLEVVVPPTIIESQTTQIAEVIEHSNVSIYCKANGHPKPSISWHRDDGIPIKLTRMLDNNLEPSIRVTPTIFDAHDGALGVLNQWTTTNTIQLNDIKSDKLSFHDADRSMAGIYVCTATNGIPTHVSKKIILYVKFPPKATVQNKYISLSPGERLEIECLVEAFPKPESYWSKNPLLYSHRFEHASSWLEPTVGYHHALSYRQKQPVSLDMVDNSNVDLFSADRNLKQEAIMRNTGKHKVKEAGSYTIDAHPHSRLQFKRLVETEVERNFDWVEELGHSAAASNLNHSTPLDDKSSTSSSKSKVPEGYVTVRQTAVNSYTYKIKLVIEKLLLEHYGQYTCISSNSLGSSEAQVIVTRADKSTEKKRFLSSSNSSTNEESADISETMVDTRPSNIQQPVSYGSSSSTNRVIYDENYLQAIKTRQNNYATPGTIKLQQKLKLRHRNGSSREEYKNSGICATLLIVILILWIDMSLF